MPEVNTVEGAAGEQAPVGTNDVSGVETPEAVEEAPQENVEAGTERASESQPLPADAANEVKASEDDAAGAGVAVGQEQAKNSETEPSVESEGDESDTAEHGFDTLGLPDHVVKAVKNVGFETPSPIQAQTIPLLMQRRDVVGLAQTGTGKTAAFALPILSDVTVSERTPQALVLAPTRELALQVADAFQSFADHLGNIHVLPIYGGQAYGIQLSGLRRGAHVVVGTPGRVIDHLERGSLDLSHLRHLVLDEADEMLNMGFQEDVERILEDTPDDKQVALFSATMPGSIRRLSRQYLDNPAEVTVKSTTRTNTNITQRWLSVAHRNKMDALTRILEVTEFEAMIVFVRTKNETEEVAEKLRARGFSAAAINGDMVQAQRERTVDQLRDGRLDILVATDVAARGLDVERISHVLNFDIPNDTESYVHRIGRTGRAGRSGQAILFVTPRERRMLRSIERATNAPLEEIDLPTVDEVNDSRKARFMDSITESLESSELDIFRTLVKSYSERNDVPLEDIAAALATQAQAGDEFLMKESPKDRRRRDREDRGGRRHRGDQGDPRGGNRFEPSGGMEMYRISVGKRHNVRPGAIVGAIANEGGLSSQDFGRISIFGDHSLVELPENLPGDVFRRLQETRISGQLIELEKDTGRPPARGYRGDRGRGGRQYGDRNDRGRRNERAYRSDRNNRGDRGDRRDWTDRNDRGDRNRRYQRDDRDRNRSYRQDRDNYRSRNDRGNRRDERGGYSRSSRRDTWEG